MRDVTERKLTEQDIRAIAELSEFVDIVPGMFYTYRQRPDGTGYYPFISPRVEEIFGVSQQTAEKDAQSLYAAIHADDISHVLHSIDHAARNLTPWQADFRIHHPSRGVIWLHTLSSPSVEADGSLLWSGFTFDVTERKKTDLALAQAEKTAREKTALLKSILESPQGIIIFALDRNYRYTEFTQAHKDTIRALWGVDIEIGMCMLNLISDPDDRKKAKLNFDRTLRGAYLVVEEEYGDPLLHRSYYENRYGPILDADGEVTGLTVFVIDITARRAAAARIEHLSHYDQLTGLPNRELLEERFAYLQSLAHCSGEPVSALWLDLDHFKDINNTLGHAVGDMMLREVTHRLQNKIRHEDFLSRQSGDEFVLVLAKADHQVATCMIHRLQEMMKEPVSFEGQDIIMTLSIGIAVYPSDGGSLDVLLRNAETAMYLAKAEGRNNYRFFTNKMQERSAHFLALGSAIKLGLGRGEFRLVYQPQFELKDRRLVGAEALLRWQHPQWGAQSPGDFIPVAETLGLIVPLGEWILQQAVHQIRTWQDQGFRPIKIAVNLSAAQFVQSGFPERIANLIHEEGISSEFLELELTETVALKEPESAVDTMKRLTELGFSLSIDDFGTGYSSLSYLKRFAVYKLKIDRCFVSGVNNDSDDMAIVTAIIQMAHSLGLKTIAEGVETAEQLEFLEEQGCDEVQGHLFHYPLEVKDFEEYLRGDSPGVTRA